ncbi:armadillo-type protein [Xylaria flabelliformis]|nr:armadillo-type protein [Xylaria flabelliformis]
MGPGGLLKSPQHTEGIVLSQVYPTSESKTATNIDVIALHGLDTNSSETWTWKHRGKPEEQDVNWLKDPYMLPKRIPTARIFTCDWPATIFQQKDTIQMTMKELARRLLLSIRSHLGARPTRPILFIASCLGGIVLAQALTIAFESGSGYESLWKETRGIVFLATPFGGTAFKDIAEIAVRLLELKALLTGTVVTNLLDSLQGSDHFLQELVADFTNICPQTAKAQGCQLAIFYETKMSNPYRKAMPKFIPRFLADPIADIFNKPKPLVDSSSARLHIVKNPIALERTHVMMNKFSDPDDYAFNAVSGQIKFMVSQILEAQPIEKAKNWVHYNHYSGKLDIERLSGDLLQMKRCYINLAIVIQPSNQAELKGGEDGTQKSSSFSLFSRLRVETPQEGEEITLPTLFEPRETDKGQLRPSRIMIRGRAGVGKTTLCKKIVYEFIHNNLWQDLYDIVLWIPLRNLKDRERCMIPGYNLNYLLRHEFFSKSRECDELVDSLWHAIDTKDRKVLFILDGLDEVSSQLNGSMLDFLNTLLNQSNVIVTSRPNATVFQGLDPFDLDLETVGFYPDQVKAYIGNAFTDQEGQSDVEKVNAVQSFLDRHRLVQNLVRIPIQLDAFCYIWNDTTGGNMPETMTAIYQQIVKSLWRKDAIRLAKWDESKLSNVLDGNVKEAIYDEIRLLQYLAFNGMYSDVIEFEPAHRNTVIEFQPQNGMLLDDMLGRVSFLRSSDPSLNKRDRSYHFLHLTFQEYFAAQYFVQQWEAGDPLECLSLSNTEPKNFSPTRFLQRFKYNTRYDIFWRFVAGLLNNNTQEAERFFQAIQDEPRDILGPTHQRLVTHCLNEVSKRLPSRASLEDQLVRWITSECQRENRSNLTGGVELRDEVIVKILQEVPEKAMEVLWSLSQNQSLSEKIVRIVVTHLDKEYEASRCTALRILQKHTVAEEHLPAIIVHLKDRYSHIRSEAISAIQKQPTAEKHLPAIIECLEDSDMIVRRGAAYALQDLPITEESTQNIMAYLKHGDRFIVASALDVFVNRPVTEKYISAIIACLEDECLAVRHAARHVLFSQSLQENHLPAIKASLESEDDDDTLKAALKYIRKQPAAEEYCLSIIACLEDRNSSKHDQRLALILLEGEPMTQAKLQAITAFFGNEDHQIIMAALRAIEKQPNLPVEILRAVTKLFKDEDYLIRTQAVKVFECHHNLPVEILRAIEALFRDEDRDVRCAAVELMKNQPNLSTEFIEATAALFRDEDDLVRCAALEMMEKQPNLSVEILRAISKLLKDVDYSVRMGAVGFFQHRRDLPVEFFRAIAALFNDGRHYVRWKVVDTFLTREALSSIPNQHVKSFYEVLLERSFEEHIAWQIVEGTSYITLENQEYSEKLPARLISAVRKAQRECGNPFMFNSTDSQASVQRKRSAERPRRQGTKKSRRV